MLFPGVPLIGSLAPEEIHSKGLLGYSCHLVIPCVYFDHHYIAHVSTQLLKAECSLQSGKSGEQLFERGGLPTTQLSFAGARLVGEGRGGRHWWGTERRPHAAAQATYHPPNVSPPYMTTSLATNIHHQPTPQLGLKKGCKNASQYRPQGSDFCPTFGAFVSLTTSLAKVSHLEL